MHFKNFQKFQDDKKKIGDCFFTPKTFQQFFYLDDRNGHDIQECIRFCKLHQHGNNRECLNNICTSKYSLIHIFLGDTLKYNKKNLQYTYKTISTCNFIKTLDAVIKIVIP